MSRLANPHAFLRGENVSPDDLNANLRAVAGALDDVRARRYTYGEIHISLAGLTNASNEVLRQFAIRRPGVDGAVEVFGAEVVIYADVGDTWTLSCSDATFPDLDVETAGATTEAHAASVSLPIPIPSSSSDVTFTLSCPSTSTIVDGVLILHTRCDRGDQGNDFVGLDPDAFSSDIDTDVATVEYEVDTMPTAAINREAQAESDLRADVLAVRALAAAVMFRISSGERRLSRVEVYSVANIGRNVTVDLSGAGLSAVSVTVNGTGATNRAHGGANPGATANVSADRTDPSDDVIVTFTPNAAGGFSLVYAIVWWR